MSDVELGPEFTPEEDAFFESGGETPIADTGADTVADPGDEGAPPAEKPGAKAPDKVVSLSALHEERKLRQERDKENQKLALENAELKGKFSIIDRLNKPADDAAAAAAAAAKLPPTAEDDIFGAVKHAGETVAQLTARLDAADKAAADAAKATTERTVFVDSYKADAAKFEATKPDYRQAYDFILKSRAAELQAIGYDTPQALHDALTADEFAIAQMAFSKGKSPAEMLYALATQRGYKAADPAAATGKGAEKLDTIERGQAVNKSLSDVGSPAGDGGAMTAAALIAMPMEEFTAWTEKHPKLAARLLGG